MHIILARKRFTTSTAFLDSCPNVLNCKKFFGSDNLSHDFQKISFPFYILLYYLWTQFLKVESNVAFFHLLFFYFWGGGRNRRFHSEHKKQDSTKKLYFCITFLLHKSVKQKFDIGMISSWGAFIKRYSSWNCSKLSS